MASYAFTLPFAVEKSGVQVLLGQRQLIQRTVDGKSVQGIIPEWAGQWGLIGGAANSGETPKDTAIRTFHEQTGLDMKDNDVCANFLLQNQSIITLKTPDYREFNVLCVFTNPAGIELVSSVIGDVIGTPQCSEGTLAAANTFSMNEARKKTGPTPPPTGGWQNFLIQSYYGGKAPGQLNTEINVLTNQITNNAAQDSSFFTTALSDQDTGA